MDHYFDANATTPLSPEAFEAWASASRRHWHNPSGLYPEATEARAFLEGLRAEVARILNCEAARIIFTSGATESNNAVLATAARRLEKSCETIAISAIEHPSVAEAAEGIFAREKLRQIGVTSRGEVDLMDFATLLETGRIGFVSLMAANNETGVLQPWAEAARMCRIKGIPFHCDASQWFGKLPPTGLAECDFVTASAHKFGGPVGVGFLVVPYDSDLRGQAGGPQEEGRRGGTENLPAIAAMVAALKNDPSGEKGTLRDQFEHDLAECLPGLHVLGAGAPRLGNTSMFVLPEHKNLRWLTRLGKRGFAVSTGSACSAGKGNPSRVMHAMGCRFEEMGRVLRVSALPNANAESWEALLDALLEVRDELASGSQKSGGSLPKISLEDL